MKSDHAGLFPLERAGPPWRVGRREKTAEAKPERPPAVGKAGQAGTFQTLINLSHYFSKSLFLLWDSRNLFSFWMGKKKIWPVNNFIWGPYIKRLQSNFWPFLPLWFHDWNTISSEEESELWGSGICLQRQTSSDWRHSPRQYQSHAFCRSGLFEANYLLFCWWSSELRNPVGDGERQVGRISVRRQASCSPSPLPHPSTWQSPGSQPTCPINPSLRFLGKSLSSPRLVSLM